jgi:hypothetical protein
VPCKFVSLFIFYIMKCGIIFGSHLDSFFLILYSTLMTYN